MIRHVYFQSLRVVDRFRLRFTWSWTCNLKRSPESVRSTKVVDPARSGVFWTVLSSCPYNLLYRFFLFFFFGHNFNNFCLKSSFLSWSIEATYTMLRSLHTATASKLAKPFGMSSQYTHFSIAKANISHSIYVISPLPHCPKSKPRLPTKPPTHGEPHPPRWRHSPYETQFCRWRMQLPSRAVVKSAQTPWSWSPNHP